MTKPKITKKFNFIIQSKGGVGKSFLTYILGVKHEDNKDTYLLDVDGSTKTSTKQLKFLHDQKRIGKIDLLDKQERIARDKLFGSIEEIAELSYTNYILDFGAPECEQLPALFSRDVNQEDLKAFADYLNIELVFHVIIAGGTAYTACVEYLNSIVRVVGKEFKIVVWMNENTLLNYPQQIEEIHEHAKILELQIEKFGDVLTGSVFDIRISQIMQRGLGLEGIDKSGQMIRVQMNKLTRDLII
ncbi:hypothetical protein [Dyadobacter psychrotolerans]|jgi:hypothetical protein|uniref:ParA family protein n=1 Tax=Dyadobacter psychrotolerans TaxID=2541721 RepID=A0A4R5DAE7_9BACT|nr:hypothetical protein [Dyadobacter psychrotolerans]TDE09807.1 hypothetical protein E0F88_29905 [Dyadobacter psychrotolerans]